MKNTIERWLGTLFGLIFVALSCMVAVETLVRKIFNFSLQGADELGGYTLALGATIAFSMALMGSTHIRVDVLYDRLPAWLQTGVNWLSTVSLAAFAGLLAYLAWFVVQDTREYMSVSQTPWATPLQYPQSAWLVGLILFALMSAGYALRATWLLVRGDVSTLSIEFGPRTTKDEVDEELQDLKARSSDETMTPNSQVTTGTQK